MLLIVFLGWKNVRFNLKRLKNNDKNYFYTYSFHTFAAYFYFFHIGMKHFCLILIAFIASVIAMDADAAGKDVLLPYGDMNRWTVRKITESSIIGGNTKTLYEVGPNRTLTCNEPYVNGGGSPWATSNVMAKVMGVVKTNTSVYREKHGSGYCAKLTTHIESVRVAGLFNIKVLAAGSMYLGEMREPISGTKDGLKAMNFGIRFNKRPKALKFDYKVQVASSPNRIKQTGFSRKQTVAGKDCATAVLLLQKRTEDSKGNITAKRVGTMVVKYNKSTGKWINNATYDIMYGDIRNNPHYDASTMKLRSSDYARNSKGKSVIVKETGWASANETPTHMILQFASSHGGAFIGSPGNTLWIDNVRLVY